MSRTPEAQAAYRKRKGADYLAMNRKHQREHNARHPEKRKARSAANKLITKYASCPSCGRAIGGGNRVELHHKDYSKPTSVKATCSKCHPKGGWSFKRGTGVGSSG